jgi:uncharacterized membrane protein (DUF373 family)
MVFPSQGILLAPLPWNAEINVLAYVLKFIAWRSACMSESVPPQDADAALQRPNGPQQMPAPDIMSAARLLTLGEIIIQVAAGIMLFFSALLALGYTVYHFVDQLITASLTLNFPNQTVHLTVEQNIAEVIINLVSDLLLVLIIGEVFNTVLRYLRLRVISLKPFLFIGIISATRDILAISARISVLEVQAKEFTLLMIELGVNLAIVLGLSLAMRLIRKEDASDAF